MQQWSFVEQVKFSSSFLLLVFKPSNIETLCNWFCIFLSLVRVITGTCITLDFATQHFPQVRFPQ
jgi:hypothetical protein